LVQKEDERSILARRMAGRDPLIREVEPDVPLELAAICDRAMCPEPMGRFQTARDFREVLERYLASSAFRVGAKEVGQLLCEAFEDERARVRAIIEQQVRNIDRIKEPISLELHPSALKQTFDSL